MWWERPSNHRPNLFPILLQHQPLYFCSSLSLFLLLFITLFFSHSQSLFASFTLDVSTVDLYHFYCPPKISIELQDPKCNSFLQSYNTFHSYWRWICQFWHPEVLLHLNKLVMNLTGYYWNCRTTNPHPIWQNNCL